MTSGNARAWVAVVAVATVCAAAAGTIQAWQDPAPVDAKVAAALTKGESALRARAYQDALDASNQMTWPEYIDANRQIERIYDVHSFPTWIVIDADGIIRDRIEAWGPTTRDDLSRAIDRAMRSVKAPSANR